MNIEWNDGHVSPYQADWLMDRDPINARNRLKSMEPKRTIWNKPILEAAGGIPVRKWTFVVCLLTSVEPVWEGRCSERDVLLVKKIKKKIQAKNLLIKRKSSTPIIKKTHFQIYNVNPRKTNLRPFEHSPIVPSFDPNFVLQICAIFAEL